MILVDASIWGDHLRHAIPRLHDLLMQRRVLGHPYIRGEVCLGSLSDRETILERLDRLPQANVADHLEVVTMVERRRWYSRGIGYVDAHLLASLTLTPGSSLWSKDHSLRDLANELGRSFTPS